MTSNLRRHPEITLPTQLDPTTSAKKIAIEIRTGRIDRAATPAADGIDIDRDQSRRTAMVTRKRVKIEPMSLLAKSTTTRTKIDKAETEIGVVNATTIGNMTVDLTATIEMTKETKTGPKTRRDLAKIGHAPGIDPAIAHILQVQIPIGTARRAAIVEIETENVNIVNATEIARTTETAIETASVSVRDEIERTTVVRQCQYQPAQLSRPSKRSSSKYMAARSNVHCRKPSRIQA